MKKKLLVLSSFLLALGVVGCSSPREENTPIIDGGNSDGNDDGKNEGNGNVDDSGNQDDDGSSTQPVTNRKALSDYADENGELSDDGWKRMIKDSYKFCEQEEEQGAVLLFNKEINGRKTLPLLANERNVSLFGQGTRKMFLRSGTAGAAPNDRLVIDLEKAFETNGFNINKTLLNLYATGYINRPADSYEANPNIYTDDVKATFANYNDAAIITLVRAGTENADPSMGSLELSSYEKEMIRIIKNSGKFNKIILLLNSPMPMSMDWVDSQEYGVDAALWIGTPGYYGSAGAVHVLMGKDGDGKPLSPSGHLCDTFAAKVESAPAMENFGNTNVVVYKEGIYVGYKYYETRYEDLVLNQGNANSNNGAKMNDNYWNYANEVAVPFGYGESYTTFESRITGVNYNRNTDQYEVEIEVKNTGSMDAKYSGQVYVQQPYTDFDKANGIEKSAISLMGYDKVDVKAGETKKFVVNIDKYFLASYDYVVNKRYFIERGDYYFAIGNGAHEALNNILALKAPNASLVDHNGNRVTGDVNCAKKVVMQEDVITYAKSHYDANVDVTNKFDDADYNYHANLNGESKITYLSRKDWDLTWPTTTTNSPATSNDLDMSKLYATTSQNKGFSAAEGTEYNVRAQLNGRSTSITFAEMALVPLEGAVTNKNSRFKGMEGADVWDMFIKQMTLDDLIISVSDNRGIFSVAKVEKPANSISEGSEGLLSTFNYGDKRWATGFATGSVYTSTWDHEMQKKFGSFYAEEALHCGVNVVNGPGANIVRTAYTSRASEFMCEDSMLSYNCAANIVGAARQKGLVMNIKHALLNNQESGRQGLQTYCNEQAIREIYLRPFEGALTKGNALGVATSYNRIGATYAACHNNLMNGVMRGEWHYRGLIIDDALTGSNTANYPNGPAMLHNGTDIFYIDGNRGNQLASYVKDNDDLQILKDLQRANKYIMYALSRSSLGLNMNKDAMVENLNTGNPVGGTIQKTNPITDQIKALANAKEYNFDPTQVHFKKSDLTGVDGNFDFNNSEVTSLPTNGNRDGVNIVYKFEGSYTEGYQGQYSKYHAKLWLWEDGLFAGTSYRNTVRGYWYDSDENNVGNKLVLVTSNDADGQIITTDSNGFYSKQAVMYLHPGWGDGRSVLINGYMYYPDVALFIDTGNTNVNSLRVGSTLDINAWSAQRVIKNLKYSACYEDDTNVVTWKVNGNAINDGIINLSSAGTYVVTATWGGLTGSVSLIVK